MFEDRQLLIYDVPDDLLNQSKLVINAKVDIIVYVLDIKDDSTRENMQNRIKLFEASDSRS